MNKVMLMGRLTREPDIRWSRTGDRDMCVARFTLAVNRRTSKDHPEADFISCVAFGKRAEFFEKYTVKGTKLVISGQIQTGSYVNKDNQKVYTTDVIVDDAEFAESKNANAGNQAATNRNQDEPENDTGADGFMNIPDGIEGELPFM